MDDTVMKGFYEGTYKNYIDNEENYKNGIYFARDKGIIYALGKMYSNAVKNITLDDSTNELIIYKLRNESSENDISRIKLPTSGGGSGVYDSGLNPNITTSAVGGITAGLTVSELEGLSYNALFDILLFPTVNPTYTNPSVSITYSGNTTVKVGTEGPAKSAFTGTYNRGSIKISGVEQNKRAGEKTGDSYNRSGSGAFDRNIELGNNNYTYSVTFADGPQPYDSKGGEIDSPWSGRTLTSSAVTINGTYPWYASTSGASKDKPVIEQSLVAWNTTSGNMETGEFTLLPTDTTAQTIKLPREIHTLFEKNSFGNWDVVTISTQYISSTETINNRTYYVYTYNIALGGRGSVILNAKF